MSVQFTNSQICTICDLIYPADAIICADSCKGRLVNMKEYLITDYAAEIRDGLCKDCEKGDCEDCDYIDPNDLPDKKLEPCKSCSFQLGE